MVPEPSTEDAQTLRRDAACDSFPTGCGEKGKKGMDFLCDFPDVF